MDAPAQWDEPGKEAYRIEAIAQIKKSGGAISDSATYEEVRRYQAGFRDIPASVAPAAISARRSASDAHAEDDERKRKPVKPTGRR